MSYVYILRSYILEGNNACVQMEENLGGLKLPRLILTDLIRVLQCRMVIDYLSVCQFVRLCMDRGNEILGVGITSYLDKVLNDVHKFPSSNQI